MHERSRLQDDSRRACIAPFGSVVNASLAASGTYQPLLAARAALESSHLVMIREALVVQGVSDSVDSESLSVGALSEAAAVKT